MITIFTEDVLHRNNGGYTRTVKEELENKEMISNNHGTDIKKLVEALIYNMLKDKKISFKDLNKLVNSTVEADRRIAETIIDNPALYHLIKYGDINIK